MTALRWLARGEEDLPPDLGWLSAAERARADGMRFRKRRTEFVLARWTAKHALAATLGLATTTDDFAAIEVRPRDTGAPQAWAGGQAAPVSLSMTDRAGWAVCVVTPGAVGVGCDLELVEPRSPAFVTDWFTDAERFLVRSAPDDAAAFLAANLVWSAKESALKVLQTGLRRDTRSVEVDFDAAPWTDGDDWRPLRVRSTERAVFPGWWRRFGEFVLTVAADDAMPPPVSIEQPPALTGAVASHSWVSAPL